MTLWVVVTWGPPFENERQIDTTENITFQQLRWWVVIINVHETILATHIVS